MFRSAINWVTESISTTMEEKHFLNAVKNGDIDGVFHYFENKPKHRVLHAGLDLAIELNQIRVARILVERNILLDTTLFDAIRHNRPQIVKHVLNTVINYNTPTCNGYIPVIFAAINHYTEIVKILLEWGAHIPVNEAGEICHLNLIHDHEIRQLIISTAATRKDNERIFLAAILNNNLEVVERLIHEKINVNCKDSHGTPAIHLACSQKSIRIIQLLIEAGADVNIRDSDGFSLITTLHYRLESESEHDCHIFKMIVDAKCDITQQDGKSTYLPLHLAASKGQLAFAKILLNTKINIDAHSAGGDIALIVAASKGHADLVDLLLSHGADVNIANNETDTALIKASENGHTTIVKSLLSAGANPNYINNIGMTALSAAIQHKRLQIAEMLILLNVDLNTKNRDGQTPLMTAVMRFENPQYRRLINLLLENGADVNTQNNKGNTALHLIAKIKTDNKQEQSQIIKLLIDSGALVNIQNNHGYTPLAKFCDKDRNNNTVAVELFINANTNLDTVNRRGTTAIMFAAGRNNSATITMLGLAGANIFIKNEFHKTAFDIAAFYSHHPSISALIALGADYKNLINTYKVSSYSLSILQGCYEYANKILNGVISISFQSTIDTSLSQIDTATEITASLQKADISNIIFLRGLAALEHVLRFDDSNLDIQNTLAIISRYLVGNDRISIKSDIVTVYPELSSERIACIREYMQEIELDEPSQTGLVKFMKKYFALDDFSINPLNTSTDITSQPLDCLMNATEQNLTPVLPATTTTISHSTLFSSPGSSSPSTNPEHEVDKHTQRPS